MEEMEKSQILIVDDEYTNIFLLQNLLNDEYSTETARTGDEALTKLDSFIPDLILLDVVMPGMTGIEVCKKISQKHKLKDIPIIMVTARSEENDITEGLEAGAMDYIKKPYSQTELKARVKSALKLRYSIKQMKKTNEKNEKLIKELQNALSEIKKLNKLLPICSNCKKIRDDQGYWNQVEEYITAHADIEFTHSLCPDCASRLYPDLFDENQNFKE